MAERTYIAIDLKSFYASVECVERGLDPLTTNLVVADEERTQKTICLAVTPSLKAVGVKGRPRLFEVVQQVRLANAERLRKLPVKEFHGKSVDSLVLASNSCLAIDYITAMPRMALYIEYSTRIYQVYLKYFSRDDIHVYSIDEVFIDATSYMQFYHVTAHELARRVVGSVLEETGITATVGIGTNLYLAKVAMDILAKKMPPDADGVRIAELDEPTYRQKLWGHTPITDFWHVGKGYKARLERLGLCTMGDIARYSLNHEKMLYKVFGVNAELLIDHAWGYEPCTMADIKAYKPQSHSLSIGHVLPQPYTWDKGLIAIREMAHDLAMSLHEKGLQTRRLVLDIGYDAENLATEEGRRRYQGEVAVDQYGKAVPRHAHGTAQLGKPTCQLADFDKAISALFERIVDKNLTMRRLNVCACDVAPRERQGRAQQLSLLELVADDERENRGDKEQERQRVIAEIREKYGRNALVLGLDLQDGATGIERSRMIGGHRS